MRTFIPIFFALALMTTYSPGDANMDGKIDAGDITKIKRIIYELDSPNPCADANQDGYIDAGDITKVKRIMFGIDPIPEWEDE